jgi:hypothetical protein
MLVVAWLFELADPRLPDDLMCTHTLYDYSGSQIYNIQWNYNTRSRSDGENTCENPLRYALCIPTRASDIALLLQCSWRILW